MTATTDGYKTFTSRGQLAEVVEATASSPGYIVFALPGSSYKMHLRPTGPISVAVGKRLVGTIACQVRRVDTSFTGGQYVEPVEGRPRRVQGRVVKVDGAAGTITLNCGAPASVDGPPLMIVCKLLDARQKPEQFAIGNLVTADVMDGATFTQG